MQEGFEDLIANDEEVEAAAEENQQLYQRREAELQRRDNEMSDEQLEEFVRKRFENRSDEVSPETIHRSALLVYVTFAVKVDLGYVSCSHTHER